MSEQLPPLAIEIREACQPTLERLAELDAVGRIKDSEPVREALLEIVGEVARVRRTAVRELRSEGNTLKELAEMTDMSPQRLHQIESGYVRKKDK